MLFDSFIPLFGLYPKKGKSNMLRMEIINQKELYTNA